MRNSCLFNIGLFIFYFYDTDRSGLQVHLGPAVFHLLGQPPRLQLDTLGLATEWGEGPSLIRAENFALGGCETAVSEISKHIGRYEPLERLPLQLDAQGGGQDEEEGGREHWSHCAGLRDTLWSS